MSQKLPICKFWATTQKLKIETKLCNLINVKVCISHFLFFTFHFCCNSAWQSFFQSFFFFFYFLKQSSEIVQRKNVTLSCNWRGRVEGKKVENNLALFQIWELGGHFISPMYGLEKCLDSWPKYFEKNFKILNNSLIDRGNL